VRLGCSTRDAVLPKRDVAPLTILTFADKPKGLKYSAVITTKAVEPSYAGSAQFSFKLRVDGSELDTLAAVEAVHSVVERRAVGFREARKDAAFRQRLNHARKGFDLLVG
jgi:hypothetical protein